MKILHVADLHIGRYFNGVSLLEDQREMLQDILRIIKEQNPDVVLIAGDLYDRSIPREDAVKLNDYFLTELVRLGKKNLVITGNHDSHERVGFLSSLLEDKGLIVENTVRRPLRCITLKDEFGPVEFYLFPYRDTSILKSIYELESFKDDSMVYERIFKESRKVNSNRKVLVYHGFVAGSAKEEMEESDSERLLSVGGHDYIKSSVFEGFHYVALGHLHKAQWVEKGRIRYSGSPMKYSFSEENHNKSVSLITLSAEGTVEVSEIPIYTKRDVVTLEGHFTELMNLQYEGNPEDYIRVFLKDQEEILDPMMRLRTKYPNILELRKKRDEENLFNEQAEFSLIQQNDVTALFRDFYKLKNEREMDESAAVLFKEILISMERGEKE